MKYIRLYKKIAWGFVETEALSKEEAENNFNDGNYDECDNKSEYEFETDWEII